MDNIEGERVVVRFKDGKIFRGFILEFSDESDAISIVDIEKKIKRQVKVNRLKAIFFVRSFEGDRDYREKKSYTIDIPKGKKIFVKFADNESLLGCLESGAPWQKGFHLSRPEDKKTGFFVLPVDRASNNIKIYVLNSAVKDVTLVG